MGTELPHVPPEIFERRVQEAFKGPLFSGTLGCLYRHYEELRRWNGHLSLIGPGTREEIVERHYGESLAALELLDESVHTLVDVGSGAGFPALVIAAARPELRVILVESRSRKWSFLQSAIRRCGLTNVQAIQGRMDEPSLSSILPPEGIDVLTSRAVAMSPALLEAISRRSPRCRYWLWEARFGLEGPKLQKTREVMLAGADYRRISEYRYLSE